MCSIIVGVVTAVFRGLTTAKWLKCLESHMYTSEWEITWWLDDMAAFLSEGMKFLCLGA
jgi:hypothetical protein